MASRNGGREKERERESERERERRERGLRMWNGWVIGPGVLQWLTQPIPVQVPPVPAGAAAPGSTVAVVPLWNSCAARIRGPVTPFV